MYNVSVISRPPAITKGGCHVVSLFAVAGILKCMHDQALHVKAVMLHYAFFSASCKLVFERASF